MIITNKHFGKVKKTLQTNIAVNGLYDCVSITQSSVMQIIHRNVGLKRFFVCLNFCYYC